MGYSLNMRFTNRGWFRWLTRVFIFLASMIPVFFNVFYFLVIKELGPKYWNLGESMGFSGPLLAIAVIASFAPIIGGPIAIVWAAWWLILSFSGLDIDRTFAFLTYGTFLLGGILCTLWGFQRRREKRGQV